MTTIIDINEIDFENTAVFKVFENSTEFKLWWDSEGPHRLYGDAFISFFSTYFRSKGIDIRYIELHRVGDGYGKYRFNFQNEKDALFFRLKYETE